MRLGCTFCSAHALNLRRALDSPAALSRPRKEYDAQPCSKLIPHTKWRCRSLQEKDNGLRYLVQALGVVQLVLLVARVQADQTLIPGRKIAGVLGVGRAIFGR